MIEAKALFVFAGICGLCMAILIGDWIRRRYIEWRETRDMRIRDKPQADSRAARHRNYAVGGDAK